MPNSTVRLPGLRIYFYSNEHDPRHVHVTDGASEVVFVFELPDGPLMLRDNYGFPKRVVNRIRKDLTPHIPTLWEEWNEHFGD